MFSKAEKKIKKTAPSIYFENLNVRQYRGGKPALRKYNYLKGKSRFPPPVANQ